MKGNLARAAGAFTPPIVMLLAVQLASGTVLAPALTFFPVYLQDLGFSPTLISLIIGLQRVTGLVTSLLAGAVLARFGSRKAFVAGQACYFLATLIFATRSGPALSLIWGASGIGMALGGIASQTYLLEQANPSYLGVLGALLYWGWTVGATLGNPAAGALQGWGGYRVLAVATAVPAFVTIVFASIALPRSRLPPSGQPGSRGLAFRRLRLAAANPAIRLLAAMRFLATFCYGFALVFVPLQLRATGASIQFIAVYAAVSNVVASLAQLAVGRIADRTGWQAPTVAVCAALAAGAIATGALPASRAVVFVGATVAISAAWSLSALIPTYVSRARPGHDQAGALGLLQLVWYLAMILGGLVGGLLYEAWVGLPMLVGGIAATATAVIAPRFVRAVSRGVP